MFKAESRFENDYLQYQGNILGQLDDDEVLLEGFCRPFKSQRMVNLDRLLSSWWAKSLNSNSTWRGMFSVRLSCSAHITTVTWCPYDPKSVKAIWFWYSFVRLKDFRLISHIVVDSLIVVYQDRPSSLTKCVINIFLQFSRVPMKFYEESTFLFFWASLAAELSWNCLRRIQLQITHIRRSNKTSNTHRWKWLSTERLPMA